MTTMQSAGTILSIICFIAWVLLYVGGWVVRSIIYVDPFFSDPYDPESGAVLRCLCFGCGP